MIGFLTLAAFIIGLATPNVEEVQKIKIAQTMAFIVIIFAELFQVFTIRNNEKLLVQTYLFI